MKFIRGLHNLHTFNGGSVCTIGAFDGVHLGHKAVIKDLCRHAHKMSLPSVVLILEPLPREFFNPVEAPPRLSSVYEKCKLLRQQGIDYLVCIRFTQALSEVTPEEFIENVFVNRLGMRYMVVGDDLRFGHKQRGDFTLLSQLGNRYGFGVAQASSLSLMDERASSTRIRRALQNSDFSLAEKILGRIYSMEGKVLRGASLGRRLGFPTANIALHRHCAALSGVYVVEVGCPHWQKTRMGVANIGVRPTLQKQQKAILEVHILNEKEDLDLYGTRLQVFFKHKLREEQRFDSVELLKEQIAQDVAQAKLYLQH